MADLFVHSERAGTLLVAWPLVWTIAALGELTSVSALRDHGLDLFGARFVAGLSCATAALTVINVNALRFKRLSAPR